MHLNITVPKHGGGSRHHKNGYLAFDLGGDFGYRFFDFDTKSPKDILVDFGLMEFILTTGKVLSYIFIEIRVLKVSFICMS